MRQMMQIVAVLTTLILATGVANATDDAELGSMLDEFLAGASVGSVEAHERFWANDLVYTSSAGVRTNKAEILDRMREAEQAESSEPEVVYTAADVDIRLYGDTAIVAFRLVGTPKDESPPDEYFNTGTFLKRDGEWRVIAWQATRIPPADAEPEID